jgi:nitroreductase
MSQFLKLVQSRQSDRRYLDKPVEEEKLNLLLEAARLAPSACNSQPWKFIVVNDPELKAKVAKATYSKLIRFNKFVPQAPVLIVIVIEKPKIVTQIGGSLKDKEYPLIDIGIAAEHITLMAEEQGLGSCMLGWFDEKKIKELLKIPVQKRIGLLLSIGYPNGKKRQKIRKKEEDVISYNQYKV